MVSVIWISGFMASSAILVTVSVRSQALYARNVLPGVLTTSVADRVVLLAPFQFSGPGVPQPTNGRWRGCRWAEVAEAWVSAQDLSGPEDLNTASTLLLSALLGDHSSREVASKFLVVMRDHCNADAWSVVSRAEPETCPGMEFGPATHLSRSPRNPPSLLA
jgi:hypothetical protein